MSIFIKAFSKDIPTYFDLVQDIDNSFGGKNTNNKKTSIDDVFEKINNYNEEVKSEFI